VDANYFAKEETAGLPEALSGKGVRSAEVRASAEHADCLAFKRHAQSRSPIRLTEIASRTIISSGGLCHA
jgi:hypothetical protein